MRRKNTHPDAPLRLQEHRRPVSRREFLAQGFLTGAATVMAPTLLSLMRASTARAQGTCVLRAGAGLIPFLCLDLAGGASIAGSNVLVGGPNGQLDLLTGEGYSKMGLPSDMTPNNAGQVNTELGIAFHSDSAFLRGIISKTSVDTRSRVNGTIFCSRSDNDTSNNPLNPMYGINRAGADGELVTLIGSQSSDSGGNSEAPMSMMDPTVRPTKVDSARDATGLIDTGNLVSLLNQQQAGQVAVAAERISAIKMAHENEAAALESQILCNYTQTADLIGRFGNPNVVDPTLDPDIATGVGGVTPIFTAGELNQERFSNTAAGMSLVVEGFAGAGTIEQGGYDYHDNTRATGEVRDFLAGQMMGAMLEFAARRAAPLMLYVLSDGSLASDGTLDNSADGRGKGVWRGDNSDTAGALVLVYSPTARPALTRTTANQIGYFRPSGSVETASSPVANNPALLTEAVVLNYLALHNRVGQFGSVLPMSGLGAGALDGLTAFQPII